ncbi:hypothetical protein [Riemerella anatipestifer]|uniref:Uncharacterized protein n=1 Tax=Riemerella anatipestifer RA-CH-1 TaxID=1228997 RepID=J9QY81_RIEAN|nr:hypothetical protein [Riemerella anatipestifer]AFR35385.1 hypothetical protein B739_0783 [Riemerella anatipestifer RA-CH-1]AIH02411.1 hypothetical protein M949_1242 [Riemerella anatipestifer CH3]MCO7332241.1 hypothetical protein [Riemerella anatipestifer]MCO7351130.1 hypothetical protein [Riemerella anatipestifer]MCU7582923.1 hypothetical protein [Riemerella anatipestifer]
MKKYLALLLVVLITLFSSWKIEANSMTLPIGKEVGTTLAKFSKKHTSLIEKDLSEDIVSLIASLVEIDEDFSSFISSTIKEVIFYVLLSVVLFKIAKILYRDTSVFSYLKVKRYIFIRSIRI